MSREISHRNLDGAWLAACRLVMEIGPTYHLLVRIESRSEPSGLKNEIDDLLAATERQSVETVANTIFPSRLASTSRDLEHLISRYRRIYPKLRSVHANSGGTYFGRMIDYPAGEGGIDQLGVLSSKMRAELGKSRAMSSCYELSIQSPEKDIRKRMQFPCLSYLSFHIEERNKLHMFASYRNHYLIERAYGNYLGLGRLQAFLAAEHGLEVGELAVLSGKAVIDPPARPVRALLDRHD